MSDIQIKTPHAISSKKDGSMKKDDGTLDFANIEHFLSSNNLPTNAVYMNQIHGSNVVRVTNKTQNVVVGTDGLITDAKQISLCVVTADCLPILLYDPKNEVIGIAHAGRKGLQKQIIRNIISELKTQFFSEPNDIVVFIGPSIERDCYEVNQDLIKEFQETFPTFVDYVTEDHGKLFLDLRNVALQCLVKEGILKEHIEISDECTKCSIDSLYSYRRGDVNGRFVSSISLL